VQATLTLLPVWLGALWLVIATSGLWRRRVEAEAADAIRDVAQALGAEVRPCFCGFRVRTDEVRVTWNGGLSGLVTKVRRGKQKTTEPGLLTADRVHAALGVRH